MKGLLGQFETSLFHRDQRSEIHSQDKDKETKRQREGKYASFTEGMRHSRPDIVGFGLGLANIESQFAMRQ